jgi:hypothetical protein
MTNDVEVTGTKICVFFAIFGTFGRYLTNLRGTFIENVKRVQNQPTLLCILSPFLLSTGVVFLKS